MKFREDMLFGHPVLVSDREDYIRGSFNMSFSNPKVEDLTLKITAVPEIQRPELLKLIEEEKAVCGFYMICENTFYNRLLKVPIEGATFDLSAPDYYGAVRLRGVVVSLVEIQDFHSDALNPEYCGKTDFPPATILALDQEKKFAIGQISKKPLESIFTLVEEAAVPEGMIQVDATGDKIRICANRNTKTGIEHYRIKEAGKSMLLNAVYLPALIQLLYEIQSDPEQYREKPWFAVFDAKCAVSGVNLASPNPLKDAQKLLNGPFLNLMEKRVMEALLQ